MAVRARAYSCEDRFKGALVGAVIGDCLGAKFEGATEIETKHVCDHVDKAKQKGIMIK